MSGRNWQPKATPATAANAATASELHQAQAIYTPTNLRFYDAWVHGFSNRFAWKCPAARLLKHYDAHITANHLDVGVGTGLLLKRCHIPNDQIPNEHIPNDHLPNDQMPAGSTSESSTRIVLMDPNPAALAYAAGRIRHLNPQTWECSVLRPIVEHVDTRGDKFDSVGLNYLLHCLPGAMADKCVAFDFLMPLLAERATIFGATILHEGVKRNWLSRQLMKAYNRRGIFNNRADSAELLVRELRSRFQNVRVDLQGCVALFSCQHRE